MSKVYQIVTDRIITALENGVAPWHRPWGGKQRWPRNMTSDRPYRGINVFLLALQGYESPYWVTFKQAKQLGGHVRKGEKGTPIIFWTEWERENRDTAEKEKIPVLRYYSGFNLAQCEGIESPGTAEGESREFTPIERCEQIVDGYHSKPDVQTGYTKAFYRPAEDLVGMPNPERFDSDEEYYSTLFHELTHSTGHSSRLNRSGIAETVEFGSQTYGREELVAEMGAAFLCGRAGIENRTIDNSASYVGGWLRTIKQDARLVVQSAAAAQKAADLILGER